jgi:hypothetical protein
MTTTIKDQYIYPPRPNTAIPRDQLEMFGEMGWIAQLKYNDSRALIKYLPDGNIELWNRHAEKFRSYTAPDWLLNELRDLQTALGLSTSEWSLLDGGLLNSKHEAIRDTLAIWDILVKNGEYLVGTTYGERYEQLNALTVGQPPWYYHPLHKKHEPVVFGHTINHHLFVPGNFPYAEGCWDGLWKLVETVNAPYIAVGKGPLLEGLVAKDLQGELSRAFREQNNGDWMTRSRVTTGRHAF